MRKRQNLRLSLFSLCVWTSLSAHSFENPDWSEGNKVPPGGRENIYKWSPEEFPERVLEGKRHALVYPVDVSGMFVPYEPFQSLWKAPSSNPLRIIMGQVFKGLSGFKSNDDLYAWLGLHHYPEPSEKGIYALPYPQNKKPQYRAGVSLIVKNEVTLLTFGCAACHTSNLFGKTVLGMTNRFPRANEFFVKGQSLISKTPTIVFKASTGATKAETAEFKRTKENMEFAEPTTPQVLGLDTSLAHTALSLTRRAPDEFATKDPFYARQPRKDVLRTQVADSKPAVWWNLKYKNRWLADGSLVSSNPIFTNFLWNEIGRGTDLHDLKKWLELNENKVNDLTAAVFASKPPRYTDFFPAEKINLARAKAGQTVFNTSCAKCHGTYVKGWESASASHLSPNEILDTIQVNYHENTPVINVGTDPYRALGMKSLQNSLNDLSISKTNDIVIKTQQGYVPPPLVGIWSRWPYFHNNSAPNLCAVLTASSQRPAVFYAGEAIDKVEDFDSACVGYPTGVSTPKNWKKNREAIFDSQKQGLSNRGHDEGIILKDGVEILSSQEKMNLIEFLKTL